MTQIEMQRALERLNERDPVFSSHLAHTAAEAEELCSNSDIINLVRLTPLHWVADFNCKGLVSTKPGSVQEAHRFAVGINLREDYLRRVEQTSVVVLIEPTNLFHPNVRGHAVCVGEVLPGTELTDLLYRIYSLLTYDSFCVEESNALNHDACVWARRNLDRFPLESRSLRRSSASRMAEAGSGPGPGPDPSQGELR